MKCPKCKGKAEYFKEVFNDGKRRREILVECDMCHGSGEVPMTNEEWLKQCTTEQLADVLLEHFEWGLSINAEYCFTEKYVEQNREHILEWLQQPHTPKE